MVVTLVGSDRIAQCLECSRVVVVAGSGGVGKTSVAAALALAAARGGRRVLALTIDPSRRLAQSLGVDADCADVQRLSSERVTNAGVTGAGSLSVLVLDPQATLDGLIRRLAPSPRAYRSIVEQPLFRLLSNYLAGANEYMAMEKVLSALELPDIDLIVLDTPPSTHALDFLRAPERMVEAVDNPVMRSVARAAGKGGRRSLDLVARATAVVIRGVGKITGGELLDQLAGLVVELNRVFGGLRERAERVGDSFRSAEFSYLLVARASESVLREAKEFAAKLSEMDVELSGVILNRVSRPLRVVVSPEDVVRGSKGVASETAFQASLFACAESRWQRQRREANVVQELVGDAVFSTVPVVGLPSLAEGVSELSALSRLTDELQKLLTDTSDMPAAR